ncbi:MAG: 5'-3' exonuclease H3TH domain-containing protein [Candidatus Pacebacteria bacterium]|nr:5'-3' exonuclease H3TH domain-containing protein [Candidatus Paceibacterota bacterium]
MKLLIIDSNALLHRSFHALPPLTDEKGEQTGAVYGFLLTFLKAINDLRPNFVVATFDTPSPTFRHKKFKKYKAKREKTPSELCEQIPKIKEILSSLPVPVFEKVGFEADDIIATITKKTLKEQIHPEIEIYILTGDYDTLQLVDKNTKVYTLGKGIKETVIFDKKGVVEKFDILPTQMVDFKALAGDPSDNIPGATGIGKKSAVELLKRFKNLENLYKEIESGRVKEVKDRIKKILLDQKEQVFFSQLLARAREDVPVNFKLKNAKFSVLDEKEVEKYFKKYGFYSLIKRIPELKGEISHKEEGFIKENRDGKLF